MSFLRTAFLMGFLFGLVMLIGYFFGGFFGLTLGLVFAFLMNFFTYWYSDKIVLWMYRAKESKDREINLMVEKLAKKADIPKPRVYVAEMDVPNAFATGRSPKHSAVCVTKALMSELTAKEIEGVLAHELAHIKNRDTLTSTVAATMAGALTWLGYVFWFGDSENRNIISYILLFILAPLAAMLIQLAISRSREYVADETGAKISSPAGLADALEKIAGFVKQRPLRGNSSTSQLFIVNPFSGGTLMNLFSTHPPIHERVRRLREMAREK
jgi:heat shock protein HtpX